MKLKKRIGQYFRRLDKAGKRLLAASVAVVVLIIAVLACVAVFSMKFVDGSMKVRAAEAAEKVYTRLEFEINADFDLLDALIDDTDHLDSIGDMLSEIEHVKMSDVALKYKLMDCGDSHYIAYTDDEMRLVTRDENMHAVIAKPNQERFLNILTSVFDGGYEYALFDMKTGLFVVSNTSFTSQNYYDSMLELNSNDAVSQLLDNDEVQLRCKDNDGKVFYLAQYRKDDDGILLKIPKALLAGDLSRDVGLLLPILICTMVLLAAFSFWFAVILKYRKMNTREIENYVAKWRVLAETSATQSNTAIFVFECRNSDETQLIYFFNAMTNAENENIPIGVTTVRELETSLNVDPSETGKLALMANDMKTGDVTEVDLHCQRSNGIQTLRFEMHCDDGEKGHIYGCAYDCTEETHLQNREISEEEFMEDMRSKCEFIAAVNLSHNKWYPAYYRTENGFFKAAASANGERCYDDDIRTFMNDCAEPDDRDDLMDAITGDALIRAYYDGNTEMSADYRVRAGRDELKWYRLIVRLWRDSDEHDLMANLFIMDINEQKKAETARRDRSAVLSRSLTALNGIYFGLFYLDLLSGMCYSAKPYRGELSEDDQLCKPYKPMFDKYIEKYVHPDDRAVLTDIIDAWYIRKTLAGNEHLIQADYRSLMGDVYLWSTICIQAAQVENGAVTKVVIGLQHKHKTDSSRATAEAAAPSGE